MFTIAIGDIHGMYFSLVNLLEIIEDHFEDYKLVFIGDYVDRGPCSRDVIKLVQRKVEEGHVALKGNHEDMLVQRWKHNEWLQLGHDVQATLASYGVICPQGMFEPAEPTAELLADIEWMAKLPTSYRDDENKRFFAHAGIHPAFPLDDQGADNLLWIREKFLCYPMPFPHTDYYIVHGHTPIVYEHPILNGTLDQPLILDHRCNLDTGACFNGGNLSAAYFEDGLKKPAGFITVPGLRVNQNG